MMGLAEPTDSQIDVRLTYLLICAGDAVFQVASFETIQTIRNGPGTDVVLLPTLSNPGERPGNDEFKFVPSTSSNDFPVRCHAIGSSFDWRKSGTFRRMRIMSRKDRKDADFKIRPPQGHLGKLRQPMPFRPVGETRGGGGGGGGGDRHIYR